MHFNDLAAMGLTNLLFYLREVILQDSVALRRLFHLLKLLGYNSNLQCAQHRID